MKYLTRYIYDLNCYICIPKSEQLKKYILKLFNILILFRSVAGAGAASHYATNKGHYSLGSDQLLQYILFMLAKFLLILVIQHYRYVFIIFMQHSFIYLYFSYDIFILHIFPTYTTFSFKFCLIPPFIQ